MQIINLSYLLWHFKSTAKKCAPSLLAPVVVCQFHSIKVVALGKETHSKQRKATHSHTTYAFLVKFICMSC